MKNILGQSGCYIFIYWQTIGAFVIQLQSFFMATFRYICLFHKDFLLRFRLSPTVSIMAIRVVEFLKSLFAYFKLIELYKERIALIKASAFPNRILEEKLYTHYGNTGCRVFKRGIKN